VISPPDGVDLPPGAVLKSDMNVYDSKTGAILGSIKDEDAGPTPAAAPPASRSPPPVSPAVPRAHSLLGPPPTAEPHVIPPPDGVELPPGAVLKSDMNVYDVKTGAVLGSLKDEDDAPPAVAAAAAAAAAGNTVTPSAAPSSSSTPAVPGAGLPAPPGLTAAAVSGTSGFTAARARTDLINMSVLLPPATSPLPSQCIADLDGVVYDAATGTPLGRLIPATQSLLTTLHIPFNLSSLQAGRR